MFTGAITALITPFQGGKFDYKSYNKLINWQIDCGIAGFVPCGTTGESPTLSHEEHNMVVSACVEAVEKRVPVIAGAGSNSTDETILMAQHAKNVGADAVLVVAPYYNKPTEEGVYQHFKAVNEQVDIPIIIYNIPGRSVIDISDNLVFKLSQLQNIVGIKDATGDIARLSNLKLLIKRHDFCYLSGEDATMLAYNSQGGNGVISVTANIFPELCVKLQRLSLIENDYIQALKIHQELMPIHQALFCETSPAPVKYAAKLLGLCDDEIRLPMVKPTKENQRYIEDILANYRN
ncbi:MAG: 4-hydroxy-tetrahydrodipicolinate synthase [Pseudomonadota bacterium]